MKQAVAFWRAAFSRTQISPSNMGGIMPPYGINYGKKQRIVDKY